MKHYRPKRRSFLKHSAMLGGALATPTIGLNTAFANAPDFSDYKAMVCIFLYGGNDSLNMMIPTAGAGNAGYSTYQNIRGNLAVNNVDLGRPMAPPILGLGSDKLSTGAGNPYYVDGSIEAAYLKGLYPMREKGFELGVNGIMPELARLMYDNKALVASNTGTLVEPVDKANLGNRQLPLFLFAHNHQQRALQTGQADQLGITGWAGRMADAWGNINSDNALGLNISYFGSDHMLVGSQTNPLVLSTSQPPRLTGMHPSSSNSHQDRRALFAALAGTGGNTSRLNFDASNTYGGNNLFAQLFNSRSRGALNVFDELYTAWNSGDPSYSSTGSYDEALFAIPSAEDLGISRSLGGSLVRQLEAAAKLIWLGANGALGSGYNRQIFYLRLGGFDNHSTQVSDHPRLLRELSLGLWKFQTAMEDLGLENQVSSFTMSDFGRTVSNNGDGTDHAWGASHFVVGGDGNRSGGNLNGGRMLGTIPNIDLGGNDDYSEKGRIIPSQAQDQLNASLCNWFGVDESLMTGLFPNLDNFRQSSSLSSAYLDAFV